MGRAHRGRYDPFNRWAKIINGLRSLNLIYLIKWIDSYDKPQDHSQNPLTCNLMSYQVTYL